MTAAVSRGALILSNVSSRKERGRVRHLVSQLGLVEGRISSDLFGRWCNSGLSHTAVQITASVFSYMAVYNEELSLVTKIWLPALTAAFTAVNLPLLKFFYQKASVHVVSDLQHAQTS